MLTEIRVAENTTHVVGYKRINSLRIGIAFRFEH